MFTSITLPKYSFQAFFPGRLHLPFSRECLAARINIPSHAQLPISSSSVHRLPNCPRKQNPSPNFPQNRIAISDKRAESPHAIVATICQSKKTITVYRHQLSLRTLSRPAHKISNLALPDLGFRNIIKVQTWRTTHCRKLARANSWTTGDRTHPSELVPITLA